MVKLVQAGKVLPFELVPEHFDGDKEVFHCQAYLLARGEPAAGDDTIYVDMVGELLVTGVEDLDDARGGAKVLPVGGQFQEGLVMFIGKGGISRSFLRLAGPT